VKERRNTKKRGKTDNDNSIYEYNDDCSCCYSVCHSNIPSYDYLFILDSDISSFYICGLHSSSSL